MKHKGLWKANEVKKEERSLWQLKKWREEKIGESIQFYLDLHQIIKIIFTNITITTKARYVRTVWCREEKKLARKLLLQDDARPHT